LAYVYLLDGTDVQAEMIKAGLAISIVISPNERHLECYRQLEQIARKQKKGIWSLPEYQIHKAASLETQKNAYRLLNGKITQVKQSGPYRVLVLDKNLEVLISRHVANELDRKFHLAINKQLQVRGWVKQRKGKLQLKVFHPANISFD